MPKSVPYGYKSIHSVELNDSLYVGETYEVTILVKTTRPEKHDAYAFDFWLFESDFFGSREMNRQTVSTRDETNIRHGFTNRLESSYITFTVNPSATARFLTVGVKEDAVYRLNNLKDFVSVSSVSLYPVFAVDEPIDESTPPDTIPELPAKLLGDSILELPLSPSTIDSIPPLRIDRKLVSTEEQFTVDEENISIFVYDHRLVDGDIITLYLNEKVVLRRYKLKKKKRQIQVRLTPGKNVVILYAENLGKIPPNTVAIEVVTSDTEFEKVLNSDLEQSEYFTIYYEPKE